SQLVNQRQRADPAAKPLIDQLAETVSWLANYGTEPYPEETRRRLKILNLIAYLIGATTLVYTLQHLTVDFAEYWPLIIVNAGLVSLAVVVPLSHRLSPIAGGVIVVIAEWVALLAIAAMVGAHAGVQLQYFIGAAAPFVVFGLERMRLVLATVITGLILHLVCWYRFPPEAAFLNATPDMINGIYTQAAITTSALIAASVWYAFTLVEAAKAETDALLRNILPDAIVEQLKRDPSAEVAERHERVAVLFADIAGFVALSKSLGAQRTVEILNALIRDYDDLAERHGVEKIKTIGDAYMAAAGVPQSVADPERRLAAFARDMVTTAERLASKYDVALTLRTGMAVGPVTAGVIGTRKFSYDIWGDTVNLAARLESASAPGRILICPDCNTALHPHFELEPQGEIEIKGVGARPVWFLGAPKETTAGAQREPAVGRI
ncbi:MAG: adenylate/guanylate cyclase domain-containing protein, partial [Pseudomonadota bacterium]